MINLLKRALLTSVFIASTFAYSPAKNIGTSQISSNNYGKRDEIIQPYLEYQKSRAEASELMVKVKHKIKGGDSFSKIAVWYGTSTDNVQASNLDKEAKNLQIGDEVEFYIPKAEKYHNPNTKENQNKNWEIAQKRTPEEIKRDREEMGRKGLALYLGITPGNLEYNEEKVIENLNELKPHILKYSREYSVNPNDIAAICKHESGFRQKSASKTGSLGPCGHTKDNYGERFYLNGINEWKEPTNPYEKGSEKHIRDTTRMYRNNLNELGSQKLALAVYNQGFGEVRKAMIVVAKKRGLEVGELDTSEIADLLRKTGRGRGGFVQEVLNELPKEGKKYPTLVLNARNWISERDLMSDEDFNYSNELYAARDMPRRVSLM